MWKCFVGHGVQPPETGTNTMRLFALAFFFVNNSKGTAVMPVGMEGTAAAAAVEAAAAAEAARAEKAARVAKFAAATRRRAAALAEERAALPKSMPALPKSMPARPNNMLASHVARRRATLSAGS